jgi:hypothetical protein
MKPYLTASEFAELQHKISQGTASLTLPRGVARQFFTHVTNSAIHTTTGNGALIPKAVVWIGILLAPLMLVVCCMAVALAFGWAAAVAIPLIGVFWTVFAGFTNENGSWQSLTIILVLATANVYFMEHAYSVPLLLFVASLWVHRMTYVAAHTMLTAMISRSFGAYDMLSEHVEICDSSATK